MIVSFYLRVLKRHIYGILAKFKFFRLYGFLLPNNVYISDLDFIQIGKNFRISPNCQLICHSSQSKLIIADNVNLNFGVMVNADGGGIIEIGEDVLIGPNVVIRAANHGISDLTKKINSQPHVPGKIVIGRNVWIGANAVILPDVTIGEGAVVAAGSVVNKSIGKNQIFGGVPAKLLKNRVDDIS